MSPRAPRSVQLPPKQPLVSGSIATLTILLLSPAFAPEGTP